MASPPFPHRQYLRFVANKAGGYGGLRTSHRHFQVWRKLKATNLDAAYPILAGLYSSAWGRLARQPVCMLRSCLAMMLCGVTSFDVWVPMMRDGPFYALISGFPPHAVPGVGTLPIQTASLDAVHDALGLFRLATQRWHVALIVPLNERNRGNLQYAGPLRLEAGVPICPADQPMKRWCFCPDCLRIKWPCPLAAADRDIAMTERLLAQGQAVLQLPPQ